jgi:hypothetical protein
MSQHVHRATSGRNGECLDLFGYEPPESYPHAAALPLGASAEAASRIHPSKLRLSVLREFQAAGASGMTADEAARALGLSVLATRPRVTELRKLGLLEPTGARRRNDSGLLAAVLRAVSVEEARS